MARVVLRLSAHTNPSEEKIDGTRGIASPSIDKGRPDTRRRCQMCSTCEHICRTKHHVGWDASRKAGIEYLVPTGRETRWFQVQSRDRERSMTCRHLLTGQTL